TRSGQQSVDGKTWTEAVVFLPPAPHTQFEIIGVRGDGFYGDIGIDDVSVELLCPGKTTTTSSKPSTRSSSLRSSTAPTKPSVISTTKTTMSTTTSTTTPSTTTTTPTKTTSTTTE
ncbi:hypothetical protein EGW08_016245, partial [Elysia chlorotica]